MDSDRRVIVFVEKGVLINIFSGLIVSRGYMYFVYKNICI